MIYIDGEAYDCETEEEALLIIQIRDNAPALSAEEVAEDNLHLLRLERSRRISDTDWWVLPDRTATQDQLDYRQALRDITDTYTTLESVVWPTKPS